MPNYLSTHTVQLNLTRIQSEPTMEFLTLHRVITRMTDTVRAMDVDSARVTSISLRQYVIYWSRRQDPATDEKSSGFALNKNGQ